MMISQKKNSINKKLVILYQMINKKFSMKAILKESSSPFSNE